MNYYFLKIKKSFNVYFFMKYVCFILFKILLGVMYVENVNVLS